MNWDALSVAGPAFLAGLLVLATHVPLGIQVLSRGIVFIDLAVAQIAGIGVILADRMGFEAQGWAVQVAALTAALTGALLLTLTEKFWPEVQEALIGVAFVLAASAVPILLTNDPHGGEQLKDLLVGQILWVNFSVLMWCALAYAAILIAWFGFREKLGRVGFYLLFACAVTVSVQLVGLYLVFASLIIPSLATRPAKRGRLAIGYAIGIVGYAAGLYASLATDVPAGPAIVWALAVCGIVFAAGYAMNKKRRALS
jgi:zinc/manganese transport system permease protein